MFVGIFFKNFFASSVRQAFQRNIDKYFAYIIKDIGYPPDYHRAQDLANELLVDIHIRGPKVCWSSRGSFPKINKVKLHRHKHDIHIGWRHGKFMLQYKKNNYEYIFVSNFHRYFQGKEEAVFVLIAALTIILLGVYFAIRWILKPIKLLSEGVNQVSQGNLDHKIRVKRKDELGRLAYSFNSMTDQINTMIQAQRQLLLDVSHELRSPLTRMRVGLELMDNRKTKKGIHEDLIQMEQMISEILESERLGNNYGSLRIEDADLVGVIKEVVQIYENSEPGISLMEAPKNLLIKFDKERIKIVLKNILENALKYSKTSNKNIEVSCNNSDKQVVITIVDYGEGIPEKDLPLLFEPFYRVDNSRSKKTGGYGLGLHLSKKIMQAHAGDISIKSVPGEGSKVTITFPIK